MGIKAVVVLATLFGRGPTRLLGFFLALYYTLRSRVARESGDELWRRLGVQPMALTEIERVGRCGWIHQVALHVSLHRALPVGYPHNAMQYESADPAIVSRFRPPWCDIRSARGKLSYSHRLRPIVWAEPRGASCGAVATSCTEIRSAACRYSSVLSAAIRKLVATRASHLL